MFTRSAQPLMILEPPLIHMTAFDIFSAEYDLFIALSLQTLLSDTHTNFWFKYSRLIKIPITIIYEHDHKG